MRYDKALGAFVELAASRHNALHASEAAEINITAERLRRGELEGAFRRLHPRVWSATALPSFPSQTLRAATLSISGAAASTTSAAWLHGWFPRPPRLPQLWVPSRHTRNHPAAELRRWQRIDPAADITVVDHVPSLNRAATLCSLGPHVDKRMLERALDDYLRTDSVRWLDETMERLGSRKPGGVRALANVRNAPHRVRGITDSWFERVVAELVALPWMPPIRLQHAVLAGDRNLRLDIACPELKLGVEAHSRTFHWGPGAQDADNIRDLHLTAAGWQILYVTWSQAQDAGEFSNLFARAARTRARQMGIDLPTAS